MAEAEELKAIEAERAKERQGSRTDIQETFPECERGETRDKVAEAVGLGSGRTYDKAETVWTAAALEAHRREMEALAGRIDAARDEHDQALAAILKETREKSGKTQERRLPRPDG